MFWQNPGFKNKYEICMKYVWSMYEFLEKIYLKITKEKNN
jgi:hypothetical protein